MRIKKNTPQGYDNDFLKKAEKEKNGKTTIFQVIAGDHFIRYDLKTKQEELE